MRLLFKFIYSFYLVIHKLFYKLITEPLKKSMFAKCGERVVIGEKGKFNFKNIYIGQEVFIGEEARFISSNAKIYINDKVMFGPRVTIVTGDHRTDVIGKYMVDVKEKLPENDKDVIISKDVWIGCNVTILKGVTIGEGSIVAAGSLVINNIEPYSVYGGVPAKKIKDRFSKHDLEKHKMIQECV